jgi:anti-sigma factor RsiW
MPSDNTHPTDLLPWYVNGSLAEPEMKLVAAHLATCDRCNRELRFLQGLHDQVRRAEVADAPGEFGLRRLMRDIRQGKADRFDNRTTRWQLLAAVAMLVVVIQAGIMLNQETQETALYTPSGAVTSDGVVLQLQFTGQATAMQIQQALQAVDASIISGPSAIGLYRVKLNVPMNDTQQIQQAIDTLKSQQDVMAYVAQE